jgi:hypothetical protein
VLQEEDVGAAARRDGGSDAGLEVVGVDGLDRDLGAQGLPGLDRLLLERLVGGRDEVHPADHVELLALRVGGGPAGRENPGEPGRGGRRAARHLHE